MGAEAERLTPTEDLKEVHICLLANQVIKIDTSLSEKEEGELVDQLTKNVDVFT